MATDKSIPDRPVAIYVLLDETDEPRWVGKTIALHGRLGRHSYDRPWFRTYVVLEWATRATWIERERYWIAFGREFGWRLENRAGGGEGSHGFKMPEWFGPYISAKFRGQKLSPDHVAKLKAKWAERKTAGWVFPEEGKRRISAANKGRKLSEEHKAKISATRLTFGDKHPTKRPEAREAARQRALAMTPETRAKIGAAGRGRKQPPEAIERTRKANLGHHRGGWKLPDETRQRISAAVKERWRKAKQEGKKCLT
jgi:hypothetical protein